MPIFPSQGGSKDTWGTELRNFFSPFFNLSTGAVVPGGINHADLANIGTNTHTQIDTFITNAVTTYAPIAKGVTNGDTHDHVGGDGSQIDHLGLINIGTNTHAQIDTFIASKAQASGLASLDSGSLVVQNPTNATATATASKIPIANGSAKLDTWISDATTSTKGLASFDTSDFAVTAGAVTTKESGLDPTLIPVTWTTPTYSAGNFTASGSMTWTVDSGDVITYQYAIIGKMMIINFKLQATTVGGTPANELRIAVPASKVVNKSALTTIYYVDNGTRGVGIVSAEIGTSLLKLYQSALTNWTASTNNTEIHGQITIEIQ